MPLKFTPSPSAFFFMFTRVYLHQLWHRSPLPAFQHSRGLCLLMINDSHHFLVKKVRKPGPPAGAGCSHLCLSNPWKHIIQQCTCMSWLSALCPRARDPRSASYSKVPQSFLSAGAEKHCCFSRREFAGKAPCSRTSSTGTLHPEGRGHLWIMYVENMPLFIASFTFFSLLKPMEVF